MRTLFKCIVIAFATLLCSGCFQIERTITLKPDGSGTYTETFLVGEQMVAFLQGLAATGEKTPAPPREFELATPQELSAAAEKMGDGVRFVAHRRLVRNGFVGYEAVYAFQDINHLTLDSKAPTPDRSAHAATPSAPLRFKHTPGAVAHLLIIPHRPDVVPSQGNKQKKAAAADQAAASTPDDREAVKQLLGGMRMNLTLLIEGEIITTNASYREGNRIVLAELESDKLLQLSPDELQQLQRLDQHELPAALHQFKLMPGRVDMNEQLQIIYK